MQITITTAPDGKWKLDLGLSTEEQAHGAPPAGVVVMVLLNVVSGMVSNITKETAPAPVIAFPTRNDIHAVSR